MKMQTKTEIFKIKNPKKRQAELAGYFLLILFISIPLFSQEKASSIHFDVIYQNGMEKCAYYLISSLEKNYKIQSEKLKFEIDDPIKVNLYSENSIFKNNCLEKRIDVNFSGSYIEAGDDAAFQLSCIMLSAMKKDSMLVNKSLINELPAWIKKGYSLYVSALQQITSPMNNSDSIIRKTESAYLKFPDNKNFKNAAVSFFKFLDTQYSGKIQLFFREAYETGGASAAFKKSFGKSEDELITIWRDTLRDTLKDEEINSDTGIDSLNRNCIFKKESIVSISPDGTAAAVLDESGVKIIFLSDGSEKRILQDNSFSQNQSLSWYPDSNVISIAYLKNNQIIVLSVNVKTESVIDTINLPFRKISDIRIYPGGKYLFIGSFFESSGIFFYDKQSGKLTRIISDYFEKLSPVLIDENTLLLFSNENLIDNPFYPEFSLYLYDMNKKEKFKIRGNIDSPSGISVINNEKAVFSFKKNGAAAVYLLDIKTAVLKTAVKSGFDPLYTLNGNNCFYFKNISDGKVLKKKILPLSEADSLQEVSIEADRAPGIENLSIPGEVIFDAD